MKPRTVLHVFFMNDSSSSDSGKVAPTGSGKISPSQFMRELRPEYYSDTKDQVSYTLEAPLFEYHLESITQRNQTHEFEIFCRKLCERTICPNLRPQTGPEGGGDSKTDSETYPVADEISTLWYVGEANGGRERWGFAFSAKKRWADKVRSDVKGIVDTGRSYERIICVTSRSARSRDRARVEDELTREHGVPVTIHDRSWIVKEVIEHDRKDLAFNYLGVGEANSNPLRLGPSDYSRAKQLREVENLLADPDAFRGMQMQRATEALVAAKLSRNLERPRTEIDGRFVCAIRLADQGGTYRQQLEARYEQIWTAYWWFDDIELVKATYDEFEAIALKADHANNLEFLHNLFQLLVNSVVHQHLSREESRLDERAARLRLALEPMAVDETRPNNSLEAQASLSMLRLNLALVDGKREDLPEIWHGFSTVVKKASGLGEFDADQLVALIEATGPVAGNEPAYKSLIDEVASFVATRRSEAEGALILLKRARQLEFSDHFEMIRLLGKAALGLSKKEYTHHLVECLQLLTLAYVNAGLLWAARASCTVLAASCIMEGEEDSTVPVEFIPAMKSWAVIAIELRHLPNMLFAIQMLNGALSSLPLTDESREKVSEDIRDLEFVLGSQFLNCSDDEVREIDGIPNVLERLGLYIARSALLYTLGYTETLREDGSIPDGVTDDEVQSHFSMLASQRILEQSSGPLILNSFQHQTFTSKILGMTVEVETNGSDQSIPVAEAILGSLEAFFATVIEQHVAPHTEKLLITIEESERVAQPALELNPGNMTGAIKWPIALSLTDFRRQGDVQRFLFDVAGQVLDATCAFQDGEALLERLFTDEAAQHRIAMVAVAANSYTRIASRSVSRISDWQEIARTTYPLRTPRPKLAPVAFRSRDSGGEDAREGMAWDVKSHRKLRVQSVIDVHLWDQARWRGAAYLKYRPDGPPYVAFLFEEREGAEKIFERWRQRFGEEDAEENIHLAIVRHLPDENPHHYVVLITSKLPSAEEITPDQNFLAICRFMTMTPEDSLNLERFLRWREQAGLYYLMPAVLTDTGQPELLRDLAILKRQVSVREATDIGENEVESIALRPRRA